MILLLMHHQRVRGSPMLHHSAYTIHLPSSHHVGILSHVITRGMVSKVQYFERETMTFTIYCYSFSILLVVNLLLYLIYKLNFIICTYRKKFMCIVGQIIWFNAIHGFSYPLGVLEHTSHARGRNTVLGPVYFPV